LAARGESNPTNSEYATIPVNVSFLQELLGAVAEQGRQLLPRSLGGAIPKDDARELATALLSGRGEASGVAIAAAILARYRTLEPHERREFLGFLATMQPDPHALAAAAKAYLAAPDTASVSALQEAVESPRQEFFRRLNLAPGATAEIVAMRRDLLDIADPALARVDRDLMHLLTSWFNRGFLVLRRIDWQTPASILEKIIEYEAVHEIQGWDDLRRRLDPMDRRCFAFFHPSLVDEPLIFVEVALMRDIPDDIQSVLREAPKDGEAGEKPTTAVFYSISNCQDGLRGISFGNFLIKQVVEELAKERASLRTFVTLSPVPQFAAWLARTLAGDTEALVNDVERERLRLLDEPDWIYTYGNEAVRPLLMRLAAHYFFNAKNRDGYPIDPVARFHLGNGARLERINWQGDVSAKGLREAHGLMCNYRYELKDIEKNHEAYENDGIVAASRQVHALLKLERGRPEAGRFLQLPNLLSARTAQGKDESG
jgi:malonyl-CoA decarboxylase